MRFRAVGTGQDWAHRKTSLDLGLGTMITTSVMSTHPATSNGAAHGRPGADPAGATQQAAGEFPKVLQPVALADRAEPAGVTYREALAQLAQGRRTLDDFDGLLGGRMWWPP
jgi:hypothetical protein